jgi:hypothetical protein
MVLLSMMEVRQENRPHVYDESHAGEPSPCLPCLYHMSMIDLLNLSLRDSYPLYGAPLHDARIVPVVSRFRFFSTFRQYFMCFVAVYNYLVIIKFLVWDKCEPFPVRFLHGPDIFPILTH